MTRVCFVAGYEFTVESFWRVAIPARELRAGALMIDQALQDAHAYDVVWIHHPLSERAERLAKETQGRGGKVVLDFSEDPWMRESLGEGVQIYTPRMLSACERALEFADQIVVATPGLATLFAEHGDVAVLPPVVPLPSTLPQSLTGALAWWSDGRQKAGFEDAAADISAAMLRTGATLYQIQWQHMKPLTVPPGQMLAVFGGQDADASRRCFERHMQQAMLALETYSPGRYRDTVSDLGLVRNAALGTPTLTTRKDVPPGCLTAPTEEWPDIIEALLGNPDERLRLSLLAQAWAANRASFDPYHSVLRHL